MQHEFTFTEITKTDAEKLLLGRNIPFTQAPLYGVWQRSLGRRVKRVIVREGDELVAYAQCIGYTLPFGKWYWYAPYGPVFFTRVNDDFLRAFRGHLKNIGGVFVRLDASGDTDEEVFSRVFKKAPRFSWRGSAFQPRAEWMLEINKKDDDLLFAMDKKHRYELRMAEKSGVTADVVSVGLAKHLDDFYRLLEETSRRDKFRLHSREYYQGVLESVDRAHAGFLVIARVKGALSVIDLVVVSGREATWVFGGAADAYRGFSPSYLSQWTAIRHARSLGCTGYSFGGVTSRAYPVESWTGVTRFKRRFGGSALEHGALYDCVQSPLWYYLYLARKKFFKS